MKAMNGHIKLLIFCGIVVVAMPFLGFPARVETILLFVAGFGVIFLAYAIKRGVKTLRLKLKRIEGQQGTFIQ